MQYATGEHDLAAVATACAPASPTTTAGAGPKGLLPSLNGTDRDRHELRQDLDVPELLASRATWTGSRRRSCSSACAAATTCPTSTTRTSPVQPRLPFGPRRATSALLDVPASLQQPAGFTSIPSNTQVDARPADARVLPGRRHLLREAPAAITSSSSACRPTASATTCSAANRAPASYDRLEPVADRRRRRPARHLRLLHGAQQRRRTRTRASSPRATSTRRTSGCSSRTRGRSATG